MTDSYIQHSCPVHCQHTFSIGWDLHRKTDDSHQVFYRNQRPQYSSDSQSLTLASLDQLWTKGQTNIYTSVPK